MVKILLNKEEKTKKKRRKKKRKKDAWYTKSLLQAICKEKVWNLQVFKMHLTDNK